MPEDRVVAIWRSGLLAPSETFIRHQGNSLTTWRPAYVGAFKIPSVLSAESDAVVFPDSPAGRRAFLRLRLTGESPALRRGLQELRPAVLHAHFGSDGWLVSASALRLDIPLVVTLHGYDVTRQPATPGLRGIRYRRNLRSAFDRASLIIAVSEFIRDRAVALGADPGKVRVHYTGVPVPVEVKVNKIWDVAFVGRFVAKKGVDDLIAALGTLPSPRPRALFVGGGPLETQMRELAASSGLDATFLGPQEPGEVLRLMAESRILVTPSKTAPDGDAEGLPTTILEAASLGVPTISTNHAGIPEAVLPERTGLLCAEGDRPALARAIHLLLTNEALRTRLGDQARQRVSEHFNIQLQSRKLEQLYDSL